MMNEIKKNELNEMEMENVTGGGNMFGNYFGSTQQAKFIRMETWDEALAYLNQFQLSSDKVRSYMAIWRDAHK